MKLQSKTSERFIFQLLRFVCVFISEFIETSVEKNRVDGKKLSLSFDSWTVKFNVSWFFYVFFLIVLPRRGTGPLMLRTRPICKVTNFYKLLGFIYDKIMLLLCDRGFEKFCIGWFCTELSVKANPLSPPFNHCSKIFMLIWVDLSLLTVSCYFATGLLIQFIAVSWSSWWEFIS